MSEAIPFPEGLASPAPKPARLIQDGDLAKLRQVFPGKFVFVYVADHAAKVADMAGSAATPEDVRLLRILLARVTLGENKGPKERN